MKKVFIWVFGILLGSILAFAVWNGFTNPDFFLGETKETTGKVIDVFPSKEVKTFKRRIKYAYSVNNKYYSDYKKLGTKDKKQVIGNELRIAYSENKPSMNRIIKFPNRNKRFTIKKFYSKTEEGYWEIQFINGIFKCKKIGEKGKLLHKYVGDYSFNRDSIKFSHFNLDTLSGLVAKPELFVVDPKNARQLIEVNTQAIFKEVKYKRR